MQISKWTRRVIGRLIPNRFPELYSTLDNPVEVPVQAAAYHLAVEKYIRPGDAVLDVGIGLGYGLTTMAVKAGRAAGIDVDRRAIERFQSLIKPGGVIQEIRHYDGMLIPYPDREFDVVTCVDVIEHVPDYLGLMAEMVRVARRVVLLSTPNRRPENTLPNGKPRNIWHLREWSFEEFRQATSQVPGVEVDWNFINGPLSGPFHYSAVVMEDTQALTPALARKEASAAS